MESKFCHEIFRTFWYLKFRHLWRKKDLKTEACQLVNTNEYAPARFSLCADYSQQFTLKM